MVVGLVLFAPACTDLEEELYTDVTAENFFTTDEEFVAALGQAYSGLLGMGNHSNLWSINEIASDELVITTKGGDWYDGGILLQLHQHEYTADNGFFNNAWTQCYGGINTCNRLIFQFEGLGTESADAFIAELRAVRALWYYWLLDAFGNVPLVTDFEDTETKANATRQQVFEFVESELNEIIPLLSEAKDGSTYGRMNKWAALAIQAKLYLNAEVYTGTARWADAEAAADEIINSGLYALEGNYATNFATDNAGSTENIFVVPYDQVFAQGFNWHQLTLHYGSQNTYNLAEQPWNGYAVVEEFYNSYVDPSVNPGPQGDVYTGLAQGTSIGTVDSRLSNFIVGPQFNPDGSRTEDAGVEPTDPDGAPLTFTPEHNAIYPDGLRQAGARIGKYEIAMGATANLSNDFVVFRLGNILLTKAEADYRQGNVADALALVNEIRARAGVTAFTALDDTNLLDEWGREMFAEMTRRQDLIRFGRFGDTWWEKGASNEDYELFPIPQVQLDANSKLDQNDGFN